LLADELADELADGSSEEGNSRRLYGGTEQLPEPAIRCFRGGWLMLAEP
jgi:hypothetical protein